MISTNGVPEGKSQFPQRLDMGLHEVKIASITHGLSSKNQTPYVEITFENAAGFHKETFYMKEGPSMEISLERLKHLGTKLISEKEMDAISGNTVAEYAEALGRALVNKMIRIKLSGKEQYNAKTQKVYTEKHLGYYPFAEAIDASPKVLKFNANNSGDFKPLPKSATANVSPDDDLPF